MGLNLEKLQGKKARMGGVGFTPIPGPNRIRLLPPSTDYFRDELDDFALQFRTHWYKQEGYDTVVSRCPRDKHEHCLACEMAGKYRDHTDPGFSELANQVRVSERHLMWLIDLNKVSEGLQAYECGPMVYRQVLEFASNPSWGDGIVDPKEGHIFTLTLTPGSQSPSGWNSYSMMPDRDLTSVVEQLPTDWMTTLDTLTDHIPEYLEGEAQIKILNRMGFPIETEGADEPAPAVAAAPTPAPAAKPAVVAKAEPAAETEVEPETPTEGAAPAVAADISNASEKALARQKKQGGEIVEPPATDDTQTPICFGSYAPQERPCDECAVRSACQMALVGI